ncbi:dehydrogenase-related [Anaeramoeba ignava]|uniref:Dehydrogenase-related n=1 Tax=Anaeramoeba ignava TaxID=1746090 RepID=A0A9Q0R6Z8_ANAIG|nr:dehydrogenase-related [Anaeramoeba ignava]
MSKKIKIGIIGAGSAGFFAGFQLGKQGGEDIEITMFEQGPEVSKRDCPIHDGLACLHCYPCRIMSGVGGAGTFSSGILNLHKNIGGDLEDLCSQAGLDVDKIINQIDQVFVDNGAPEKVFDPFSLGEDLEKLQYKCAINDIRFVPIKQRLLGSQNTPRVIQSMVKQLREKYKITIQSNTQVMDFDKKKTVYFAGKKTSENFDFLIVSPGRWGMDWLTQVCEKRRIKTFHEPLDIGVRVEVPALVMEPICSIQRDPKFHIITPTYSDFIRTFCSNHRGYVVKETYGKEQIAGVNGHQLSTDGKSENSNFAFLIRQSLTRPLEDTTKYGMSISLQTSILGGYKPLVQTLGDLRKGRRSRPALIRRNPVVPTLKNTTPGDISMAYPYRFVTDIIEGLDILDKIMPGVSNNSTLIYAPEFKRSAKRIDTNFDLESKSAPDIFFAGDGAGLSRGIIGAAVTGIIAANGILKKIGKKTNFIPNLN